jgi:hypothetical protein
MTGLVQNLLLTRTAWLRKLLDPRRDISAECGHPESITTADYSDLFERGDIARRVVSLLPEECWIEPPLVLETEDQEETQFEKAWKELETELRIWACLQRIDILSGIGQFGVLLLGFDDGLELNLPVEGTGRKLIYLRPFEERLVTIASLEGDTSNPRYGLPTLYNIQFSDTALQTASAQTSKSVSVHHSRIIHVADNRTNSEIYGTPRMKWVFNRLLDLRKIVGGSGEMFWKGGFPGLSLEATNPDGDVTFDKEATQEQLEKYMNGLQRYIALVGMQAKSLSPQVADPAPHVEVQLKLIAVAMGVPWRILVGSEAAQLASSQDTRAWNKRVDRRRTGYIDSFIIRPLIDRLMEFGALPEVEDYNIQWSDLNTPSNEEKATVSEKKTNAITKYVQAGADVLIPPFHFLTLVLGMDDEEAQSVVDEVGDRLMELEPDPDLEGEDTDTEDTMQPAESPGNGNGSRARR